MRYRGIHYHVLTIGISYKGTKINKNANVCHFFLYKINWISMVCKRYIRENGFPHSHMLPH